MGLKKKIALVAGGVFLVALLAAGGVFIWYKNDPYITAMLIRKAFVKNGNETNAIIEKYAPKNIASITNIQYRSGDDDAYLDIYYAPNATDETPTIMWIHGSGWLAGNKDDLSPWARVLASKDFNVIALNYSIAPEKHYPLPVTQAATLTAPSLCEHFCGIHRPKELRRCRQN